MIKLQVEAVWACAGTQPLIKIFVFQTIILIQLQFIQNKDLFIKLFDYCNFVKRNQKHNGNTGVLMNSPSTVQPSGYHDKYMFSGTLPIQPVISNFENFSEQRLSFADISIVLADISIVSQKHNENSDQL